MEQRSPRRHHSTELARHSYLVQQTVFCVEEWERALKAEKLTLSNRGNTVEPVYLDLENADTNPWSRIASHLPTLSTHLRFMDTSVI